MHVHCLLFCAGNNTGWAGLGVGQIPTAQNWLLGKNDFQRYGYTHQPQTGMWKKDFLFFWLMSLWVSFFFFPRWRSPFKWTKLFPDRLFWKRVREEKSQVFKLWPTIRYIRQYHRGKKLNLPEVLEPDRYFRQNQCGVSSSFWLLPQKREEKRDVYFSWYILGTLIFTTNVYLPYFFYLWLS